ncbi:MAG: hypothetical protein HIU82_08235 [Proteobacteria bacterium]|nr:hypothetical protein [Pseudomonadota bacterium]
MAHPPALSIPNDRSTPADWPDLPLAGWADTCAALHLWTQVVGKIRLAHAPMVNHWWQVPLYVTCRGLTTSPIPHGGRSFQIDFDFIDHILTIETSAGEIETIALGPRSVADFYTEVMGRLAALGLETRIWTMPVEIPDAIPFEQDRAHAAYDRDAVTRFWRALVQVERVFTRFRGEFLGKVSPVHFFWGSFDLAVTRFSGRPAPRLAGASPNLGAWVMQEAYSHEVSSVGFWPGNGGFGKPAFYSYAYPEPPGFAAAPILPQATYYDPDLGQHILPYDAVRQARSPDEELMRYLRGTYEAAADLGQWDRAALERVGAGRTSLRDGGPAS